MDFKKFSKVNLHKQYFVLKMSFFGKKTIDYLLFGQKDGLSKISYSFFHFLCEKGRFSIEATHFFCF